MSTTAWLIIMVSSYVRVYHLIPKKCCSDRETFLTRDDTYTHTWNCIYYIDGVYMRVCVCACGKEEEKNTHCYSHNHVCSRSRGPACVCVRVRVWRLAGMPELSDDGLKYNAGQKEGSPSRFPMCIYMRVCVMHIGAHIYVLAVENACTTIRAPKCRMGGSTSKPHTHTHSLRARQPFNGWLSRRRLGIITK